MKWLLLSFMSLGACNYDQQEQPFDFIPTTFATGASFFVPETNRADKGTFSTDASEVVRLAEVNDDGVWLEFVSSGTASLTYTGARGVDEIEVSVRDVATSEFFLPLDQATLSSAPVMQGADLYVLMQYKDEAGIELSGGNLLQAPIDSSIDKDPIRSMDSFSLTPRDAGRQQLELTFSGFGVVPMEFEVVASENMTIGTAPAKLDTESGNCEVRATVADIVGRSMLGTWKEIRWELDGVEVPLYQGGVYACRPDDGMVQAKIRASSRTPAVSCNCN